MKVHNDDSAVSLSASESTNETTYVTSVPGNIFATTVNKFYLLTIAAKLSIFSVCGDSGYASENSQHTT